MKDKIFECETCKKKYVNYTSMRRHMREKHFEVVSLENEQIEVPEEIKKEIHEEIKDEIPKEIHEEIKEEVPEEIKEEIPDEKRVELVETAKNIFQENHDTAKVEIQEKKEIDGRTRNFLFELLVKFCVSIQLIFNYGKKYYYKVMENIDIKIRNRSETYKDLLTKLYQERTDLDQLVELSSNTEVQFLGYLSYDFLSSIRNLSDEEIALIADVEKPPEENIT
ncbi:MAG: hypothetical protein UR43_C0020G0007 [candidate division TM6 bacterium GW2011_GWF2_33_332]|nr:MAG: hypothetical protein UR43_C0020G0007 [candidate division TM6 bacterium GW2011_GWF2_33_332]